ncbi:hypothetical protein [Kitasatospora sp. NPDC001132]
MLERGSRTAVGLLWAGNRSGGTRALMSDITVVESQLGITVAWAGQ